MQELTPRQIVAELDRHIVGQAEAKRAVAIAIRNRWRRQQLPDEMKAEVAPKNILMIGPTGVGKTEIARRLAKLTGAPFIKVEATKYTEVGYYGRDVESMVRELVENAITLVTERERKNVEADAQRRVSERLLDLLAPAPPAYDTTPDGPDSAAAPSSGPAKKCGRCWWPANWNSGRWKSRIEQRAVPMMFTGMGMEQVDFDLQGMFEKILPKNTSRREVTVAEARKILFDHECESLLNKETIHQQAIQLAENLGMIFLDEVDKIVASEGKGADVSRQGVQRDLLPIVEGTTRANASMAMCRTDHVLFIAAGAFHRAKPSDLMPELQGRFPIRVELTDLTKDDFIRILTEPKSALTKQYTALLGTEGVELEFTADAADALAEFAFRVNQTTQNIGARRLYTIMERMLEELSFEAPDMGRGKVTINAALRERETCQTRRRRGFKQVYSCKGLATRHDDLHLASDWFQIVRCQSR